jgi:hypothetical protein
MTIDSDQPTGVTGLGSMPGHVWDYEDLETEPSGTAADPAAAYPRASMVGWGFIGAAIRRRKRFVCVLTVVGFLLGAAYLAISKPAYQVTASMLMTNDQSVDQPTAMETDFLLATNPVFVQQVITKLGIKETVVNFLKLYSVAQVSNQVLSITANAPSASEATTWANALATQYLSFRAGMLQEQLSQMVAAANLQLNQGEQQVNALNKRISQVSAAPSTSAQQAELKSLQAKQAAASDHLISLQQGVGANEANLQLTVTSMISGSRVLEATSPVLVHSVKKLLIEYVGGGLFGGLVLGCGIVAIGAITSDHLRRRDKVAAALGAPVRVSVATFDKGGKLSRRGKVDRDAQRVVAQLRDSLPSGQPGAACLAVVAVGNEKFVASLVEKLAATSSDDGKRVMVADLSGGALARLLGEAKPGVHKVDGDRTHLVLAVPDAADLAPIGPLHQQAPEDITAAYSGVNVLITLATVDPAAGGDNLGTWATDAVVVVTAGVSSEVKVHAVGELVRAAGVRLTSAVLLGADRNDESLGLLGSGSVS